MELNNLQNLQPQVQQQLAMVRRDMKARSKNDVVRIVLSLLVEISRKDLEIKKRDTQLEITKKEAEIVDNFLKQKNLDDELEAYVAEKLAEAEAEAKAAQTEGNVTAPEVVPSGDQVLPSTASQDGQTPEPSRT